MAELPGLLNGNAGVWTEATAETLYTQVVVSLQIRKEDIASGFLKLISQRSMAINNAVKNDQRSNDWL